MHTNNCTFIGLACVDRNMGFALNGSLPWRVSEELQYFKNTTIGHAVICGAATFMSMPLLKERDVMVMTRNPQEMLKHSRDYNKPFRLAGDLHSILAYTSCRYEKCYVVGGLECFKQFAPYLSELRLSVLHKAYDHDTKLDISMFGMRKSDTIAGHSQFKVDIYTR